MVAAILIILTSILWAAFPIESSYILAPIDPVTLGIIFGGAGLGKELFIKGPQARRQRRLAAVRAALDIPFLNRPRQPTEIEEADPVGGALQGAIGGYTLGQVGQPAKVELGGAGEFDAIADRDMRLGVDTQQFTEGLPEEGFTRSSSGPQSQFTNPPTPNTFRHLRAQRSRFV